ncbi:hypothetical protein HMPREF3223_01271 [Cutibacterium avidum]|nr:hypothetical protein HMPREF3223_01271 [Cutibacterium avidum]
MRVAEHELGNANLSRTHSFMIPLTECVRGRWVPFSHLNHVQLTKCPPWCYWVESAVT